MTLGNKIKAVRQQKKMSQAELSQLSGVMQKNISRYELDTSIPSAIALKNLAGGLGVTTDFLLNDKAEEVKVRDVELMKKFEIIQELSGNTKEVVSTFLDLIIRDFKAKQAYA